jgi:hypothetical protein
MQSWSYQLIGNGRITVRNIALKRDTVNTMPKNENGTMDSPRLATASLPVEGSGCSAKLPDVMIAEIIAQRFTRIPSSSSIISPEFFEPASWST